MTDKSKTETVTAPKKAETLTVESALRARIGDPANQQAGVAVYGDDRVRIMLPPRGNLPALAIKVTGNAVELE